MERQCGSLPSPKPHRPSRWLPAFPIVRPAIDRIVDVSSWPNSAPPGMSASAPLLSQSGHQLRPVQAPNLMSTRPSHPPQLREVPVVAAGLARFAKSTPSSRVRMTSALDHLRRTDSASIGCISPAAGANERVVGTHMRIRPRREMFCPT